LLLAVLRSLGIILKASREIPHKAVLVNETWVFASGSNTKVCSDCTSQCARKRRPASVLGVLLCMVEHEMNFFLEQV
jgi:hypothetical protein